MIKISICGARGRMGSNVMRLVQENIDLELAGLIEDPKHKDISFMVDGMNVTSDISLGIKDSDIVIDFSHPASTMKLITECTNNNKKIVIGTTGFNPDEMAEIKKTAEKTPVLLSPNMSVGVNLVFKLVKEITDKLPDYEKEIIEAHHNRKVDAPSGTALKIAKIISKSDDTLVYGREGKTGPRKKNEIGIHAIRAGNIVGEHTVMWVGPYERVELTHRAESRDVFASGAIKAAVWLNNQPPGKLYSMDDVLS